MRTPMRSANLNLARIERDERQIIDLRYRVDELITNLDKYPYGKIQTTELSDLLGTTAVNATVLAERLQSLVLTIEGLRR